MVWSGVIKTTFGIFLAPILGMAVAFVLMILVAWGFRRVNANRADRTFRRAQLFTSALYSLGHGGNDAQKTMGIIAVLLYSQHMLGGEFHVPFWVVLSCQAAMGLGTLMGGWRIVHTMGSKITRITPREGVCAELGGSIMLFGATWLGIPVSTTHTITGSHHGRRRGAARLGGALGRRRQHHHRLVHHHPRLGRDRRGDLRDHAFVLVAARVAVKWAS